MPKIYGKRFDGKICEVRSYGKDAGEERVVVMQALTDTQASEVENRQAAGESDTQIWRALHPEEVKSSRVRADATGEFSLKLEQLTKAQLVMLVEHSMKTSVDSLSNMNREDLIRLIRNFGGRSKPARVTRTP
ncbi:MAG: hypothetical protein R3200_03010 [Xanthomonadales bacterium]|nr:hypothetical protein [Xanthomonadales bacterium]